MYNVHEFTGAYMGRLPVHTSHSQTNVVSEKVVC